MLNTAGHHFHHPARSPPRCTVIARSRCLAARPWWLSGLQIRPNGQTLSQEERRTLFRLRCCLLTFGRVAPEPIGKTRRLARRFYIARWSSPVARQPHKPEAVRSNRTCATKRWIGVTVAQVAPTHLVGVRIPGPSPFYPPTACRRSKPGAAVIKRPAGLAYSQPRRKA